MSKEVPTLDEKSMSILINYKWPGNVRQLQNVLQRLILSGDRDIASNDVKSVLGMLTLQTESANIPVLNLMDNQNIMTWREVEQKVKEHYFRFVRQNSDSDSEAARKLGLAPPNYHRMCKEMGIK
jgi:DNA-binding NtrC family response regulator